MSEKSMSDKKPKEKIEWLIGSDARATDQRISERIPVEEGTEVIFPLICRGEIVDVSHEGMSIRFKPDESPKLQSGQKIPVTLDLSDKVIHIPAIVRRVETRFGVIVMGMQFDPEKIEIDE